MLNIIVGTILTAVLGNWLLTRWQYRSWLAKQKYTFRSKELEEVKKLYKEFNLRSNARLTATRFFIRSIGSSQKLVDTRLHRYRVEVDLWMEQLSGFYTRMTLLTSYHLTLILENEIHNRFQKSGLIAEKLYTEMQQGSQISLKKRKEAEDILDRCQGSINDLSRDLFREIIDRKSKIFEGHKLYYAPENLEHFSTFELFQFLFLSRVDTHYIIRPA